MSFWLHSELLWQPTPEKWNFLVYWNKLKWMVNDFINKLKLCIYTAAQTQWSKDKPIKKRIPLESLCPRLKKRSIATEITPTAFSKYQQKMMNGLIIKGWLTLLHTSLGTGSSEFKHVFDRWSFDGVYSVQAWPAVSVNWTTFHSGQNRHNWHHLSDDFPSGCDGSGFICRLNSHKYTSFLNMFSQSNAVQKSSRVFRAQTQAKTQTHS